MKEPKAMLPTKVQGKDVCRSVSGDIWDDGLRVILRMTLLFVGQSMNKIQPVQQSI